MADVRPSAPYFQFCWDCCLPSPCGPTRREPASRPAEQSCSIPSIRFPRFSFGITAAMATAMAAITAAVARSATTAVTGGDIGMRVVTTTAAALHAAVIAAIVTGAATTIAAVDATQPSWSPALRAIAMTQNATNGAGATATVSGGNGLTMAGGKKSFQPTLIPVSGTDTTTMIGVTTTVMGRRSLRLRRHHRRTSRVTLQRPPVPP